MKKYLIFCLFFLTISFVAYAKEKPLSSINNINCAAEKCPSFAERNKEKLYETLTYERTIDGDTFVASGRKIRIWGINAPEKEQSVYYAATLYLETLLEDGPLICKFIELDRYQRAIMQCFAHNLDIASMMVQMGMAKDYKRYSGGYYQLEEQMAKKEKRGLWKEQIAP